MARLPRFVIPGQSQHVIQRGNNRQEIFGAEVDYTFFLETLTEAAEKHKLDIHAYVLMSNHIHLLVTPHHETSIGKTMQSLGRRYVHYFNHTYKRTGTLWEGRYKATLIDSTTYFLTCMRYIELNPVRAKGMAEHPSDYPWSSYHHNALGDDDQLVTPHREYKKLGRSIAERQSAYRRLFRNHLSEKIVHEIREATNKAWVLGGEQYKQKISMQIDRQTSSLGHGGDRRSAFFELSQAG